MDVSAAVSSAVSALSSGGTTSAIAVSVLSSTEAAQAQQVATLFSSIGLGGAFHATA